MNLEQELRALPIAFPDEPDLAPRVLARLERPVRRWWLVPALVAVAAAGALLAIPQTRAAILDFFRIGGVEVQRVETQPRAPVRPAALGREVSFDVAQRAVDFPLLAPSSSIAYVDGPMVNLQFKRYVLSQWRGEQLPFAQKQVGPGSQTIGVEVRGADGPLDHGRTARDRLPRPDDRRDRGDVSPERGQRPHLGGRGDHLPARGGPHAGRCACGRSEPQRGLAVYGG